jgi:hypothetical protein
VGHTIELFSDFSRQGRTYIPFPDPGTHRIKLRDLADEKVRERLKLVWVEPLALDPSRRNCFTSMLTKLRDEGRTDVFPEMAGSLWTTMKTGGFSPILLGKILRFNGSLFEQATALPLNDDQLGLLIDAGEKQWPEVEPAIFGTLLERALDKNERHKLGAHFTPRAYVERLVLPTIIEPLREQWANVQAAAVTLAKGDDLAGARSVINEFLEALCATIILDPACGTANFLYVAMEHMKRLEGEVWGCSAAWVKPSRFSREPDTPLTRTSSSASRLTPAPPPSPSWSSGSATSSGTFGHSAPRCRPNRLSSPFITSNAATQFWNTTAKSRS